MALDEGLVGEVEKARQRLEDLESDVFDARTRFHESIRRLHANGGSMREIAAALGMSHQRVHQIIGEDSVVEVETTAVDVTPHPTMPPAEESAGPKRASMRRRTVMRCSFCNASQAQVSKLIAGPGVFICGSCEAAAQGVASTGEATPLLRLAMAENHPCSFCNLRTPKVDRIVKGARARICNVCLDLCDVILAEDAATS